MGEAAKERMIEKQLRNKSTRRFIAAALFAAAAGIPATVSAQARPQQPAYPAGGFNTPVQLQLPPLPAATPITPNGAVVEDVIARVNDQIITRSEYERSQQQLLQEAQQQSVTPSEFQDRQTNLLRDMIDQQILLSKGKELGITGDAETMRRLDDIRKQNHLESMEALEKAAASQGVSFEDFKSGIRNNAITQQVVRDEVGRRLSPTRAQEQAYYNAHTKEFEVPEQVHLSEILVPTADGATDAQIAAAQAKADGLEAKLKGGAAFADVAKSSSGGPTASAGGDLGDFKRGSLGDVLEKATFSLPVGGYTAPIRTRQGFVILKVDTHQQAGVAPLADVENQVQEAIYLDALQPALRAYLTKAREDAYIDIKPGFVDTGSSHKETKPVYTAYAPPAVKKKVVKHQRLEQQKAVAAQAALAAARDKVAEKNALKASEQAAKASGLKNASKPVKAPKVRREKIRYGQAPRNALPTAPTATVAEASAPISGQAPGVAMAPSESITSISTGTGVDENADPLTPQTGPVRKTRYAARQKEEDEKAAQAKLAKAEVRASARPVKATADEAKSENQQAGPLGLNGDTGKKKKKPKHVKGTPKERLKEVPKAPVDATQPVAPTVNPALASTPTALQSNSEPAKKSDAPSSDQTTLPPVTQGAPGALPQGQPLPAATGANPAAQPNADPAATPR